jgi:hypothetical protein
MGIAFLGGEKGLNRARRVGEVGGGDGRSLMGMGWPFSVAYAKLCMIPYGCQSRAANVDGIGIENGSLPISHYP